MLGAKAYQRRALFVRAVLAFRLGQMGNQNVKKCRRIHRLLHHHAARAASDPLLHADHKFLSFPRLLKPHRHVLFLQISRRHLPLYFYLDGTEDFFCRYAFLISL